MYHGINGISTIRLCYIILYIKANLGKQDPLVKLATNWPPSQGYAKQRSQELQIEPRGEGRKARDIVEIWFNQLTWGYNWDIIFMFIVFSYYLTLII